MESAHLRGPSIEPSGRLHLAPMRSRLSSQSTPTLQLSKDILSSGRDSFAVGGGHSAEDKQAGTPLTPATPCTPCNPVDAKAPEADMTRFNTLGRPLPGSHKPLSTKFSTGLVGRFYRDEGLTAATRCQIKSSAIRASLTQTSRPGTSQSTLSEIGTARLERRERSRGTTRGGIKSMPSAQTLKRRQELESKVANEQIQIRKLEAELQSLVSLQSGDEMERQMDYYNQGLEHDQAGQFRTDMEEDHRCASQLQAQFRGYKVRQTLKAQSQQQAEEEQSAVHIQALVRGKRERQRVARVKAEMSEMEEGARTIQKGYKSMKRRRGQKKEVLEANKKASTIQAAVKGRNERRRLQRLKSTMDLATANLRAVSGLLEMQLDAISSARVYETSLASAKDSIDFMLGVLKARGSIIQEPFTGLKGLFGGMDNLGDSIVHLRSLTKGKGGKKTMREVIQCMTSLSEALGPLPDLVGAKGIGPLKPIPVNTRSSMIAAYISPPRSPSSAASSKGTGLGGVLSSLSPRDEGHKKDRKSKRTSHVISEGKEGELLQISVVQAVHHTAQMGADLVTVDGGELPPPPSPAKQQELTGSTARRRSVARPSLHFYAAADNADVPVESNTFVTDQNVREGAGEEDPSVQRRHSRRISPDGSDLVISVAPSVVEPVEMSFSGASGDTS
ncbi:unnamed protein product [Chrysoparadoxa australica]